MENLYFKTDDGDFLPIELKKFNFDDLDGALLIASVGSEQLIAKQADVDLVNDTLKGVLDSMYINSHVLVVSQDISIDVLSKNDAPDDKHLYIRIVGGFDDELEQSLHRAYKRLKDDHKVVLLPTPVTIDEYKLTKDILKRSKARRVQRRREQK